MSGLKDRRLSLFFCLQNWSSNLARPRIPTTILELRGSFKAHPERLRGRALEPQPPQGVGPAPAHLSARERACYEEIVALCAPGVLGSSDALVVEHAARVLGQLRHDRTYNNVKLMLRLEAVLGRLGLTPADRSKVNVLIKPPETPNRFYELTVRKPAKSRSTK